MEYRKYNQTDENKVVDLWNKCLTFDTLTEKKFRKQAILDDNFDDELTQVVYNGEKLVGFIYATVRKFPYLERGLEPHRGWINVMFVHPSYQRQGIGTKLLKFAENKLSGKEITIGAYSPNYFFWGVDKDHYQSAISFFEKHGYKADSEHYSMGRDLHGFQFPEKVAQKKIEAEAKGYKFVNFEYKYTLELLNFLRDEFGGGWKRNALMAMQADVAEDVLVLCLDKDNKICGCCNRAIDGNPMRIGPIGIAESQRNAGIGTVLFTYAMYEMSKRGIYRVFFVTTNDPGRRYYERQGLSVIRTTVEYRKEA